MKILLPVFYWHNRNLQGKFITYKIVTSLGSISQNKNFQYVSGVIKYQASAFIRIQQICKWYEKFILLEISEYQMHASSQYLRL